MKLFYEVPTQVRVEDADAPNGWVGGIAYEENVICGCCGGIFPLEELNEDGLEVVELPWVSISDEIKGE